LFPTTDARESFNLIRALCRRRQMEIPESEFSALEQKLPLMMTPGSAETLAVKIYRLARTESKTPVDALRACLTDYQNPVPLETLKFQADLAVRETSDLEFVPELFRHSQP
jgi:hypothetical protein